MAGAALLLALDVSGVVRGETGRSWMPLMPFLLVASLVRGRSPREGAAGDGATGPTASGAIGLALLLLAQAWTLRACWQLP
jgi:hypothetical protein